MKAKNEKGITLVSLTIYIIAMLVVVSIVTTISLFFYNNVINIDHDSQNLAEFNKFNMYFLEETKKAGNMVIEAPSGTNIIKFSNGATYTYIDDDDAIYKDKIRICENI